MQQSQGDVPGQGALVVERLNSPADSELGAQKKQLCLLCSKPVSKAFGEHPCRQRP